MAITNPYPEEFGHLRIGTPINADFNKVINGPAAFDSDQLHTAKLLTWNVNMPERRSIQGGGYDTQAQDAWNYSVATNLGLNVGFVGVTAKFDIAQSSNVCSTYGSVSMVAKAEVRGEMKMHTEQVSPTLLLSCATEDFCAKIKKIRDAASKQPEKLPDALTDFYLAYGTGFISTLQLGAIGIAYGTASIQSTADEKTAQIGGGIKLSTPWASAEAAASYGEQHQLNSKNSSYNADSIGEPPGSGPAVWAHSLADAFASKAASAATSEIWTAAYDKQIATVEPPVFTEKPPSKKEAADLPEPAEEGTDRKAFRKALFKRQYMKNHGAEPTEKQYADFEQACEEAFKALEPVAKQNDDEINNPTKADVALVANIDTAALSLLTPPAAASDTGEILPMALNDGANAELGGFAVTGYTYTRWTEVLPELLDFAQPATESQVAMGRVMVWLSIRALFQQYLAYCTFYPAIAPDGIATDATIYSTTLEEMQQYISHMLDVGTLDLAFATQIEEEFKRRLAENDFGLQDHYQYLVENYPWLKHVPFGAVPVMSYSGRYYYPTNPHPHPMGGNSGVSFLQGDAAPRASELVENTAMRLYPILSTDKTGKPYFVWTCVARLGEVVTAAASMVRVGMKPSEENFFKDLVAMLDKWGPLLLPPVGGDPDAIVQAMNFVSSDFVHILPEKPAGQSYGKLWNLQKTRGGQGPRPNALVLTSSGAARMLFVGTGDDLSSANHPFESRDIQLVPITYKAVRNAPGREVKNGGMPMWLEPRTDELVAMLNAVVSGHSDR